MPKVTILCGESPLPVCQALKTLAATEVVIIHGQGRSKTVHAPRVAKYCFDILQLDESKVHLVEVDAFNPLRCQATLEQKKTKEVLASSTLVYGPGTAVMNALIFDSWANANPNWQKQQFWYLQANPSQLLPSNKEPLEKDDKGEVLESEKTKKVVATGLNSAGLIDLHILPEFTLQPLKNPQTPAPKSIAQALEDVLYKGKSNIRDIPDEAKKWLRKFNLVLADGFLMEAVVYHVLKQGFNPEQITHSVKVFDHNDDAVLEMDVLLRQGDNHLWISCFSTSKVEKVSTEMRKKFFEAKENAVRLAGKEARSITIVNRALEFTSPVKGISKPYNFDKRLSNGIKLRRKLDLRRRNENNLEVEYSDVDRHIIVDLAELLGDNPSAVVSDASNQLQHNARPELFKWISNALNH